MENENNDVQNLHAVLTSTWGLKLSLDIPFEYV